MEILGEVVVSQSGGIKRVRKYLRGVHPDKGIIIKGFTGLETMVEIDIIERLQKFVVFDMTPSLVTFSEVPEIPIFAGAMA